jgi:hypothetical protein
MQTLWSFVAGHPLLVVLLAAFTVWMALDAWFRDDVEPVWFWMVVLLPIVGAVVYAVAIKLTDLGKPGRLTALTAWFSGRPSLAELRYRAENTPTLVNHFNLAVRLMEQSEFAEALPHLEAALKMEPEHGKVLFCLARCHKGAGHPEQAVPILEGLLARDPRWGNYAGWKLLIDSCAAAGDEAGAIKGCRELARLAATMETTCVLAQHLIRVGQMNEARTVLERALRDYDFGPSAARRRNRRWAREARRLLRQTETRELK